MRLTKFNPETGMYEYVEKAKTLDEFREQRKTVIQKLGEYEDIYESPLVVVQGKTIEFPKWEYKEKDDEQR